jgi:cell division cycle 20-like protein 1, cofactor of APC complex
MYKTLLQAEVLKVENPHMTRSKIEAEVRALRPSDRVLDFTDTKMEDREITLTSPFARPAFAGFEEDTLLSSPYTKQRFIPKTPYKVLDAPALYDDFYLNLVDWSSQNTLAVGLGSCIYLWSATCGQVTKLHDIGPNDTVTSVQWSKQGHLLAVGTHTGQL